MPKRKFNRFKRKSFRFRGRRFGRGSRRSFKKNRPTRKVFKGLIITDEVFTKLKLVSVDEIAVPNGGIVDIYSLKGNSIFQPYIPDTAQFLIGVRQYASFYSAAKVFGSKITIQFQPFNQGVSTVGQGFIALTPVIDAVANASVGISDVLEQKYTKYKTWNIPQGNSKLVISYFMSTQKLFGKKTFDDNFQQNTTETTNMGTLADPVDLWLWKITSALNANNVSGQQQTIGYMNVKITYYIKYFKRKAMVTI